VNKTRNECSVGIVLPFNAVETTQSKHERFHSNLEVCGLKWIPYLLEMQEGLSIEHPEVEWPQERPPTGSERWDSVGRAETHAKHCDELHRGLQSGEKVGEAVLGERDRFDVKMANFEQEQKIVNVVGEAADAVPIYCGYFESL
jgi:hypothetical protein